MSIAEEADNMTPREGLTFMLAAYEGKPHWVGYPDILRKAIDAIDRAEADKAAVEDHTAIIAVLKTKIAEADRLAFVLSIAIGMLAVLVVL